jgi:hypothetical protein
MPLHTLPRRHSALQRVSKKFTTTLRASAVLTGCDGIAAGILVKGQLYITLVPQATVLLCPIELQSCCYACDYSL